MALAEFIGCALVAFGPSLSMFCVTIALCPIRVIIFITAAFFWLMSLLLSSILWCSADAIFKPSDKRGLVIFGVVEAVLFQELFRLIFYKILRKAEYGLKKVTEVGHHGNVVSDSRQTLAYVSGLGFGAISGGFSLLNVLAEIGGPASVGLFGQSEWFVLVSSFTTSLFILLNTAWGVILFYSYDAKNYVLAGSTVLLHLICSLLTLFNKNGDYVASLVPITLITVLCAGAAFRCAGGKYRRLGSIFSRVSHSESESITPS
ncbi:gamma-secretase subunit Aph-1-like [Tropilaelaps mercedesae]|uniref:Gamma-secretase subunit Aph-1-like n=1 Tax=Tropilaelaps mercedesae TaxID=418985 RepID=A0A1V9XV82_9ACAR|nr:gamma-secretase subunit Aph-1-like [Tropilaelaps mercedesae]